MRMCNFKSQGKEITLVNNLVFSFPLVYLMMVSEDFYSANLVLLSIKTNCFQSNQKEKKKKDCICIHPEHPKQLNPNQYIYKK